MVYYELVSVALLIQYAKRTCHIILTSVTPVPYFPTIYLKGINFEKKLLNVIFVIFRTNYV